MTQEEVPIVEWCRHENGDGDRCNAESVVIVWGKLFEAWDLGPRCVDHLPHEVQRYYPTRLDQVAVLDLRGLSRRGSSGGDR